MNFSSHSLNVSNTLQNQGPKKSVTKMVIVLALTLVINYINGTLIHTFRKHQIFYMNPRYILFIHLVMNDMIQLTTSVTLVVLGNTFYRINVFLCFLILTFAICTTINTPLNLAIMAVECYITICFPLRHTELCTIKRTYFMIGCVWATNIASVCTDIFLNVAAEPKHFMFNNHLYCEMNNVFRHPVSLKKKDIFYMLFMIAVWLTIFYTYLKIFLIARAAKAGKSTRRDMKKARNTILLHGFQVLLCMLTYVGHYITRGLISLFPKYFSEIIFTVYIVIYILPRFVSPMVYGLRDNTFKEYLKRHLLCTEREALTPTWHFSKPKR